MEMSKTANVLGSVEISLITAQLEVLDYLALNHSEEMSNALEVKIDWFRSDLADTRDKLLKEDVKKRMVSVQSASTAFMRQ